MQADLGSLAGRLPRQLRDTRVLGAIGAGVLLLIALLWGSIPPGGGTPDIRELPGEVSSLAQELFSGAQPESGYPRIRVDRVHINLLLVKGDGKTPPVKYEAYTYPGADHLLASASDGRSNTYIYAHARNGMFWELHDLHIGDVVVVDYGAGKVLRFRVSEIHPKIFWKDFKWLQPTGDDRLTLQTCNGWKDDDPRFVVIARRVSSTTA
jgi:LPXTG-site transpeptidase (sortase) family protein